MKPSNTSLTKHLYRIDEVLSSLRWSIITHNITEATFWALEVYESELINDALEILETLWLTNIGFGSWSALSLIQSIYEKGEISQQEWLSIICALARNKVTDSTIFHLLLRGAVTSSSWKPEFPHTISYNCPQDAILDCLHRGKLIEAWLLGRSLSPKDQWSFLEKLAIKKDVQKELIIIRNLRESVYECLATAYVLVSLEDISWISCQAPLINEIPSDIQKYIDSWTSKHTFMRNRRAFQPRPEALLYLTQRSQQLSSISSEPDIQDGLLETLMSSELWSGILSGFMNHQTWISDSKKEQFYDTYFPQDIPDEWSLHDREQSHGRGLGKSLENARARFIHHILQRSKSLELWDSSFPMNIDCSMEWDSLYSEVRSKASIQWPLKPLKKVFQVLD